MTRTGLKENKEFGAEFFQNLNGVWTTSITIAANELSNIQTIQTLRISIYTDGPQALLALDRTRISSQRILERHKCITEAAQGNVVTLRWIEGNSKGNRIADRLAKKAAIFQYAGTRPSNNPTRDHAPN